MATTLATLRTALSKRLRLSMSGDALLDSVALNECLNLGSKDLSDEHHWPWLLTSATVTFTAGIAPFPATPVVRNIRELVINGRRARRASSLAEFLDVSADGSKNVWFESGQTVTLAPVPAVTVITTATLHYLQVETTLLTDLNTPLLPDQHIPTLIARAAYHANIRRANYEAATQDQGEYMEHVKKMKTSYPTRSGPRQIRPSGVTPWAVWG